MKKLTPKRMNRIIEFKSSFNEKGIQPKNKEVATKYNFSYAKIRYLVNKNKDLIDKKYLDKLRSSQKRFFCETIENLDEESLEEWTGVKRSFSTSRTIKAIALKRDEGKCRKCGVLSLGLEAHHIIPVCYGGKETIDNYIMLCYLCHYFAPYNPKEFLIYLNTGLPVYFDKFPPFLKSAIEIMFDRYNDKQILEFRKNPFLLYKELYPEIINLYKKSLEIFNDMRMGEEKQ